MGVGDRRTVRGNTDLMMVPEGQVQEDSGRSNDETSDQDRRQPFRPTLHTFSS
jgi:hypothetical protein